MTNAIDQEDHNNVAPAQRLLEMIFAVANSQMIGVVARLGIADLLKDGPTSIEELAESTGTHVGALSQVMRALTSLGIFAETETGRFSCTPLAKPLQSESSNSYRSYAIAASSDYFLRMWSNILHSVNTGESAFEDVFGMNAYEYYQQNPEDGAVFYEAMTAQSKYEGIALRDAYDFSDRRVVVDVGGGRGFLLATILEANPSVNGILIDLASVVEGAHATFDSSALRGRCEFVGGDFLSEVPSGGDLYILKRVLIDKNDDQAKQLLANCREAIGSQGKMLVADPDVRSHYGNLFDVFMLGTFGGRLRTQAELQNLFASTGFELSRTIDTESTLTLVEAIPV